MTQETNRRFSPEQWVLPLCGLVAVVAVGNAMFREYGGQPERDAAAVTQDASLDGLRSRVEQDPGDGQGWQRLGSAQFERGEYADAAKSYAEAARIDPSSGEVWSALGEARVMASERDPMPADAVSAFEKAIALDADNPRARYFMAVRKDLAGDHEGAIADWLALLADTPPGAPWQADLKRTIEQVGKINAIDVASRIAQAEQKAPASLPGHPALAAIPGPTDEQLSAARTIRPSEQRDMAESMVTRLESRLKGDPGNVDGWIMLMRSRMTLNQPDLARRALDDAIAANPARATMLRQQARILGVS